ncbi:MAG: hypothetical protein EHM67_08420 [Hyphomicrobiaceae bacterium]|nr:MAG: hypothetical protein EHM67_08420 [Hyphomicrobiaceae bacterium]
MPSTFKLTVKGTAELKAGLKRFEQRMVKRWMRGAVGEMANVVRDQAITNAQGQGLAVAGQYPTTPGGRMIDHRGYIPFAVKAWVEPAQSRGQATAGVRVVSGRRKTPTQTYHWRFVEYGGPTNPVTRPFWERALPEAQERAQAAAAEVIYRQVSLFDSKPW